MKTHTLACLCLCLLLLVPAAAIAREIDETRSLSADGSVMVENLAGSVTVQGWDRAEVRIQGTLGDSVEELEISSSDGSLKVRVRNPDRRRSVDESFLRLSIPAGASLDVETVSADIEVSGLDNRSLALESVSGDIEVSANTARLEVESVSGDVEFSGSSSRVSVETVSGEIELRGGDGEVRVSTVSGDLELEGGTLVHGRFETVSGDLDVTAGVADDGRLNAESMSGDVTLVLPRSQQAEFGLQTFSGRVQSNFGPKVERSDGPGSRWNHREGANGATIRVESFSGDVRIQRG